MAIKTYGSRLRALESKKPRRRRATTRLNTQKMTISFANMRLCS